MTDRRLDPEPSEAESVVIHPKPADDGEVVVIVRPTSPTAVETWLQPEATAVVVPGGPMPAALYGVSFLAWEAPTSASGWELLASAAAFEEPPFAPPAGSIPAAGVVIQEADGRIWMVGPTNRFGGHELTFPKGRLDRKSLKAAALAEAWEESGLQVELTGHLVDLQRSLTFTRYYVARRIGGSPADMGWESQCVVLVPPDQVSSNLLSGYDLKVLAAVQGDMAAPDGPGYLA